MTKNKASFIMKTYDGTIESYNDFVAQLYEMNKKKWQESPYENHDREFTMGTCFIDDNFNQVPWFTGNFIDMHSLTKHSPGNVYMVPTSPELKVLE